MVLSDASLLFEDSVDNNFNDVNCDSGDYVHISRSRQTRTPRASGCEQRHDPKEYQQSWDSECQDRDYDLIAVAFLFSAQNLVTEP